MAASDKTSLDAWPFMDAQLGWGINTTSCGHVTHAACWQKYVETVRHAESRRHARYQGLLNIKRNEFFCPLCDTIGNAVLPILPELAEFAHAAQAAAEAAVLAQQQSGQWMRGSSLFATLPTASTLDENSMDFTPSSVSSAAVSSTSSAVGVAVSLAKKIELSYEDWLDGLEKTIENSIGKKPNKATAAAAAAAAAVGVAAGGEAGGEAGASDDGAEDVFIINPCPLSSITKLMADVVAATNFRSLFEFESYLSSASGSENALGNAAEAGSASVKLHAETSNIIENFTRSSYTIGFAALPFDGDPRMPISMWTNCAYTIETIGKHGHFCPKL